MRRAITLLIVAIFFVTAIAFATDVQFGEIEEQYKIDKFMVSLSEYRVETIDGVDYLYLSFEYTNTDRSKMFFGTNVVVHVEQNGEICLETYNEIPEIETQAKPKKGETAVYTNAYELNNTEDDVTVWLVPYSQRLRPQDEYSGVIEYKLSLSEEAQAASVESTRKPAPTQMPKPTAKQKPTKTPEPKKVEKLQHGELLNVTITGNIIVVKAKIGPSYSNKATIDQNYYNVEYMVSKYGIETYKELQYWAVADMTDGSEAKVISFTVPQSVMVQLKNRRIAANMLGSYVKDLWIHPSLR